MPSPQTCSINYSDANIQQQHQQSIVKLITEQTIFVQSETVRNVERRVGIVIISQLMILKQSTPQNKAFVSSHSRVLSHKSSRCAKSLTLIRRLNVQRYTQVQTIANLVLKYTQLVNFKLIQLEDWSSAVPAYPLSFICATISQMLLHKMYVLLQDARHQLLTFFSISLFSSITFC